MIYELGFISLDTPSGWFPLADCPVAASHSQPASAQQEAARRPWRKDHMQKRVLSTIDQVIIAHYDEALHNMHWIQPPEIGADNKKFEDWCFD